MKQEEALKLVDEFLRAHGLSGSRTEDDAAAAAASDEGKGEDLFAGGDPEIAFRYIAETGVLKCYVLIYQFADDPKPGVVETCRSEAAAPNTEMGGGELEYDSADRGLYLSRSYTDPVSVEQLSTDLFRLQEASVAWGEDVLGRVADQVFRPEEHGR